MHRPPHTHTLPPPPRTLQTSFGDVFLGETFSCYISVANASASQTLVDVGLKVEVQTQQQREILCDSAAVGEGDGAAGGAAAQGAPPAGLPTGARLPTGAPTGAGLLARFEPLQRLERVVQYELKDVGVHILICTASFAVGGERSNFRKFFKFQVQNPLQMKSKTHVLPSSEIIIETQIQNATKRTLFLEQVDFLPTAHFESEPLSVCESGGGVGAGSGGGAGRPLNGTWAPGGERAGRVGLPSIGEMAYLKPGDVQQHMFRLRGKRSVTEMRQVSALGRMQVRWKGPLCEAGRLHSNTLQRQVPPPKPVEVCEHTYTQKTHSHSNTQRRLSFETPATPSAPGGSGSSALPGIV